MPPVFPPPAKVVVRDDLDGKDDIIPFLLSFSVHHYPHPAHQPQSLPHYFILVNWGLSNLSTSSVVQSRGWGAAAPWTCGKTNFIRQITGSTQGIFSGNTGFCQAKIAQPPKKRSPVY